LRDRVSDREKFDLDANYHWMVTGDLDKEIENDELARQTYPRDDRSTNDLAVNYCLLRGQFEKGIQLANETLRLNPHGRGAFGALACGYLGLNRPDEARTVLESAITNDPENPNIRFGLYWVYTALGDAAGSERQIQWASGKYNGAGMLTFAAGRAASLGKIQRARELTGQAQEILRFSNFNESIAGAGASLALVEAIVGNTAATRQQVAASQTLSRSRANLPMAGLALALADDSKGAEKLLDDFRRRYPSDFLVNGVFGPCAQALVQSGRGNTAAAIQALQPATRYELAPAFGFVPLYVRGLVYLRGHQGKDAAAAFQKVLDHHFLTSATSTYGPSYVGLARSWSMAGDSAKARAAYQDFFALWKDADPDIPILKQAKAEYAKLQ